MKHENDNPPVPQAFLDTVREACLQAGGPEELEALIADTKPEYPVVEGFFASEKTSDLWPTKT